MDAYQAYVRGRYFWGRFTAAGIEKAGANLTVESFVKGLESVSLPRDIFGADEVKFSATKHQGSNRAKVCQIVNGRWTSVTDYLTQ